MAAKITYVQGGKEYPGLNFYTDIVVENQGFVSLLAVTVTRL
jgi:hypothetical protein